MNARINDTPIGILYAWHLALVTNRIDECTKRLWNDLGIGPWQFVTFTFPEANARVNGKETEFRVSAAITQIGFLTLGKKIEYTLERARAQIGPYVLILELPLTASGPLQDFLCTNGQGIHRIGLSVDDVQACSEELQRLGHAEVFRSEPAGLQGKPGAAYFDTDRVFGTMIELTTE